MIDKIVQLVMDVQNQENTTIPLLEKQLREVNKKLDNLMKAIEDGLYTRTTKERLEALEIQKDELTAKIADEQLKKPSFNEDFIRFWLMKFRKFDISQKKQWKALIEIFVNAIFLYDDRMLITVNYKDGTQTVRFEDTLTADCGEKSLRLRSNESPSGAFEWQHGLRSKWRSLTPTSARPCDRTFSSIENLWPQVDTCFRPFRATLKISEVEPQCTLKILQSKTCEKAKPLLVVTVHTERSSYPCFAAALSGSLTESVRSWRSISFRRLM